MKSWLQYTPDLELKNDPEKPRLPHPRKSLTRAQWRDIKRRRQEAEKKQIEGIESQDIFKKCIEGKLERAGAAEWCIEHKANWWDNFQKCGEEKFYLMCAICGDGHEAFYQCSNKWCPRCNWRISMNRRLLLGKMTAGMNHVRHVVLTQRNFPTLTREKIMASRKNLLALRRQEIFGKVSGGCASLEFTNEGKGWHMHWHLLLQTKWIDAKQLSVAWGKLVGQEFAIVKVIDCDEKSYLQELCKYVVEGSELAKWEGSKILELITALRGTRSFTTFGKFREIQKFAKLLLREEKPKGEPCSCGCNEFVFGVDRQMCQRVATKKGY